MERQKNNGVLGIALCMTLLVFGCGTASESPEETGAPVENAAPAQADKNSLPNAGDVWPVDWVGNLPVPNYQSVQFKVGDRGTDSEGMIFIELKAVPDGDAYIGKLTEMGYSSLTHMKIGEGVNFIGVNEEESSRVQVTYNYTSKECSIVYGDL